MYRLTIIKIIHTLIWIFFNFVLFVMASEVIINKIDNYFYIGFSFIALEWIVLQIFKMKCPLTIIARKYSDSTKDNFDIYLPNWLAKYNKLIYIIIFTLILIGYLYRTLTNDT